VDAALKEEDEFVALKLDFLGKKEFCRDENIF
jgi:hypothetical protein